MGGRCGAGRSGCEGSREGFGAAALTGGGLFGILRRPGRVGGPGLGLPGASVLFAEVIER
jgi:hypothetical protein